MSGGKDTGPIINHSIKDQLEENLLLSLALKGKNLCVRVCVCGSVRVGERVCHLRGQPHQIHKGQNKVEI